MNLEEIRNEIDQVDEELVQLLEQRMTLVSQVAELKKATGIATLDPGREGRILNKIAAAVDNPDFAPTIVDSFKDILKASRAYQDSKKQ